MTDVRLVLLRHAKDNVLDERNLIETDWADFCSWLHEEGHELRGVVGDPSMFEGEYKDGSRGASKPAGMVFADPRWGDPSMEDDRDLDFIERHGSEVMRRAIRNFTGACAVVALDLDDLTLAEHTELRARLQRYDAIEYSTYSHGKNPDKVKLRLIVRLDREQTASEVPRVRRGASVLLGLRLDGQTVDVSRIFYRPAAHPDRAAQAFIVTHKGGTPLSVDACLAEAPISERDLLAKVELVWDGVTPASPHHRALAAAELTDWMARCARMTGEESKRTWLLQRTMRFGSYIASGCLPGEETRQRMHARVRELMEFTWSADDHTVEYRLAQIDQGLADGQRRGGVLPQDAAETRRTVIAEHAKELHVPDDVAAKMSELSGFAWRDLMHNTPDRVVRLDEARIRSFEFGMKMERGRLLVDSSSAGSGKSYNMAKIASAKARVGLTVVIQTRENTVGAQTREQIDPDIPHVQLYSPLSPPEQAPASNRCLRADELSYLKGSGMPVRAVCTKCPLNERCEALEAHRERMEALETARVVFVSQAGISQAADLLRDGALLMTDEQPDTGDWDEITDETLKRFASGVPLPWIPRTGISDTIAKVATAMLELGPMPDAPPEEDKVARAWDVPAEAFKSLEQTDRETLQIARKLWNVYLREREWSRVNNETRMWKLDRAYVAMIENGGLLCDATPFRPALPRSIEVIELRQHVQDAAPVKRVLVGCPNLTGSHGLFPKGRVDGARMAQTFRRLRFFVDREGAKSTLFVTFKAVEQWMHENRAALDLPAGLQVAHFGAVRGKNQWKDYDLIYVFGTPRFNRKPLLDHLLKDSARVREEWSRCAAAELEQAIARLRPVSRTTPCTLVCESEVVPWSWYAGMDRFEIHLLPEEDVRISARNTLLSWLANGVKQSEIALALDVEQSTVSRWASGRTKIAKECVYAILSGEMNRRFLPAEPDPVEEPEIPVDAAPTTDVDSPPDLPEDAPC